MANQKVNEMPKARYIDIEEMKKLFTYNPDTGDLTWNYRDVSEFKNEHAAKSFNNKKAGKVVGNIRINKNGKKYRAIKTNTQTHLAHRVCWAIYHNEQPEMIDHINGDGTDNRILNLRSVSVTENNRNARRHKTNTSGYSGVSKYNECKWQASIWIGNKQVNLGCYDTKAEAVAARKSAEKVCGYHENHGSNRPL